MTRSYRLMQLNADLAVKGTFHDPDWMFKTGIGGMLNAGSVILWSVNPLLLPLSFALISLSCGYLLRVMRYKLLNPDSHLPDWDSWLELFISGLTWLAIQFGLCLLPLSVLTIALL
ncbi:MAG: DUF4013 domain-containing protein, partial [Candidatus Melainabacteria bacterium]|nr:DUF4013 domain-containing protein [Candidatus Melainabacteria bacterium]